MVDHEHKRGQGIKHGGSKKAGERGAGRMKVTYVELRVKLPK
jgi:hypothetical protein